MKLKTRCPYCQQSYHLSERLAGKIVRCRRCSKPFPLPEAELSVDDVVEASSESAPSSLLDLDAALFEEQRLFPRASSGFDDRPVAMSPRQGRHRTKKKSACPSQIPLATILTTVAIVAVLIIGIVVVAQNGSDWYAQIAASVSRLGKPSPEYSKNKEALEGVLRDLERLASVMELIRGPEDLMRNQGELMLVSSSLETAPMRYGILPGIPRREAERLRREYSPRFNDVIDRLHRAVNQIEGNTQLGPLRGELGEMRQGLTALSESMNKSFFDRSITGGFQ